MTRIQKLSSYLIIVFDMLLIALPLFPVMMWVGMDTEIMRHLGAIFLDPIKAPTALWMWSDQAVVFDPVKNFASIPWTPLSKSIGLTSTWLGLLPLYLALFPLKALFQSYRRAEFFSAQHARHYRGLGALFFLNALLAKPLSQTLKTLAITLANPPGYRCVEFGMPNLEALFYGVLMMVISWVMLEASQLQDEQKLTI